MKSFASILLILLSITASTICNAKETEKAEPTFATLEVTPGIYMLSGVGGFVGGNVGLSVGEDGVILIDDAMPPFLDKMKNAIKSVTDKPVSYLINTHVHADHTGNNAAMGADGAVIVAHENLRLHMLDKGVQTKDGMQPAPKSALPVITFSHAMSFHLNGDDAEIFHVKNAHTNGDVVIKFKNANVIHTGDTFFNGMFPYIDINNGGSVDGYIAAQKKILAQINRRTKIIPGHGPLATMDDLRKAVNMLIETKKLISYQIDKGQSEDEVVKANPLKKYHEKWNWAFITTEKMTRQVYKSLTK
ncbi:MAG: NADPH-quinone reductase [Gammaproteobacteria bacterium]|nr:MAG: NADPH-quinone reductase [Gammaproteobacteria bacterium]